MQVQFNNTDKTAGTIDGRNFTISATGNICINRSKATKAATEAILAAKAVKPAAVKKVAAAKVEQSAKPVAKKQAATFGSAAIGQLAAVKPAAVKKDVVAGGRAPTLADEAKIVLMVKENPKREGCAAHVRFQAYFTSKTVADALATGLTRKDLAWDIAHGFISIK